MEHIGTLLTYRSKESERKSETLGRGSIPHCCSTWLSGMETSRGILEGKGRAREREQRKVVSRRVGRLIKDQEREREHRYKNTQ